MVPTGTNDRDWAETYWPPWEVPISLGAGSHKIEVGLVT